MSEAGSAEAGWDALVRLSAALATRDAAAIDAALLRAAEAAAPLAVEEALLQAHLFVGFPLALEALSRWREITAHPPPPPSPETPALWAERGPEICQRVYGSNYSKLRRNVAALHPDLDRWMVEGGYGRVLGRPGLDLATRELCIVALLAVWRAPRQLHSHLRGARNAGAPPARVERALQIASEYLDHAAAAQVHALWSRIAAR